MPNAAADIFRQAAALNLQDTRRQGNLIELEGACDVIVAGDIHGNRRGLGRIISYFERPASRPRRLILQEIIHGPVDGATGQDRSVELLLRAARLKLYRPADVIFLLGNHDLAQVTGVEITKDSIPTCRAFADGVSFAFGPEADEVLSAVAEFLSSLPLAARCPNGAFITHSLPSPKRMQAAGTEILHRSYRQEDFFRGGAAYEWTWGRGHTDEQIEALAKELGVELFILGHRHTSAGIEPIGPRAVSLASDHDHGCLIEFAADRPTDVPTLLASAIPLVALE